MEPPGSRPPLGPERWLGRATWGFVGLGISLRIAAYGLNFPLWWDEAFVAVNLLRRGYLDLLRPLDYGQVCPILFLWAELSAVSCSGSRSGRFGWSRWPARFSSVFLFRYAAGRSSRGVPLLLAVAVFSVSSTRSGTPPTSSRMPAIPWRPWFCWPRPWPGGVARRAGPIWVLAMFAPIAILAPTRDLRRPGDRLGPGPPRLASREGGRRWSFGRIPDDIPGFPGAFAASAGNRRRPRRRGWPRCGGVVPAARLAPDLVRWLVTVHAGGMLAIRAGVRRAAPRAWPCSLGRGRPLSGRGTGGPGLPGRPLGPWSPPP